MLTTLHGDQQGARLSNAAATCTKRQDKYMYVCMYVNFPFYAMLCTFHFRIHSGFSQQFLVVSELGVVSRKHQLYLIQMTHTHIQPPGVIAAILLSMFVRNT